MNQRMPSRRAAATRLIDWTGERAVPWTPDVQVVYEHFHRYLWARTLVRGRRVLDIGSGEGFGAALLAGAAASVTGIDIDPRTVEHSQLRYGAEALTFSVASATDLGHLADGAFDVIVAFEVIEHVEDHERVMAEIERLLSASGIVIMSTPDRHTYSEAMAQENVFHVRELSALEFRDLLGTRFAHVQLFGQRAVTGSRIEAVDGGEYGPSSSFALERPYDEWQEAAADVPPLYLLAVAGRSPLPEIARQSALSDYGLGLLREAEGAANERATELMARSEAAEADIRRALKQIDAERVERYEVQERVRISAADRDREAVEWARKLDLASQEAAAAHAGRERAQAEHEAATAAMRRELQRISESVSWRVFQKARGRLYGVLGGHTSPAGRAVSATLRTVNRVATRRRPTAAVATGAAADPTVHQDEQSRGWTIAFPTFAEPVVSIVIPVYNGAELTERCLRAVLHATDEIPYEVIVVDDGDDPEVRRLLDGLEGVVVLRNKENLGYLRSVNRGSAAARGQHILQLNNDTEPQPGCLAPLLSRLDSSPDIGIVVPKLLFPDGRLQEAGSIVWRDGNAYNYGFGAEEAAFPYNFTRDVDYGSAAAMLVRGSLWRELGGFDERFAPGYYEDVDLCFATRRHGQRVVYEPASRIIHVHGGSMGTDITVGAKRYQEINRSTFAEKWAHALTEQH
ncbi:MAG: glycosyl transferase, partial [Solirubrobacterales bacterium]|nr:glycosyl transferase [Solirubrobacterales bacterium]